MRRVQVFDLRTAVSLRLKNCVRLEPPLWFVMRNPRAMTRAVRLLKKVSYRNLILRLPKMYDGPYPRLAPVWIAVPRKVPRASSISQKNVPSSSIVMLRIQSQLWERDPARIFIACRSPHLSPVAEQTASSSDHSATEFPKEKHNAATAELGGMCRAFFSSEVALVLNFRS